MTELLENGEVVCPVFNYQHHPGKQTFEKKNTFQAKPGEKIRIRQACDACTFDVKQAIEHVMYSEQLELRFECGDTAGILINPNRCYFKDGIMNVEAVLK